MAKSLIQREKDTLKKFKGVVAGVIKNIGYTTIAKQIPKMSVSNIEKNSNFVINKELAVGKGCEFLTNPITRKRTKNPMRPKYKKAKTMLKEAITRMKVLERNIKKGR